MAQKILIAEDERILRSILEKKIRESGYETFVAENGEEAIDIARREKPDMLILDIVMPKKNGFDVMEALKKENILPITVIISNSGDIIDTGRAYKLGAKTCIVKTNFDPNDVVNEIQLLFGTQKNTPVIQTGTPSVLLVEDEAFIRELIVQKLRAKKFILSIANDGETALALLEDKNLPSIIILDIVLPGISGFEVLKKIKGDKRTKSIPVIILSNLGQKNEIEEGLHLGAEKFLIKANLTLNDLVTIINETLHIKL